MASLNRVMIIGNCGGEPEMRFTPNGRPVTTFSVATNSKYQTAEGEQREETEWFSCVAWGRLAETVNQFVHKGMQMYVEGRLKTREWEGDDGQRHYRTEIVANTVLFLSRRQEQSYNEQSSSPTEMDLPDIPF